MSTEVLSLQRLRADMEAQAAAVRESQAAIARDAGAMRDALQASLSGMAASVGAYGRQVAATTAAAATAAGGGGGGPGGALRPGTSSGYSSSPHRGMQEASSHLGSVLPQLNVGGSSPLKQGLGLAGVRKNV